MSAEEHSDNSLKEQNDNSADRFVACTILLAFSAFLFASTYSYADLGQYLGLALAAGFSAVACAILALRDAVVGRGSS